MPTARLSMRRIREVLRLRHAQGLSERAIAQTLGLSNGVVNGYLKRARHAGLEWPLPEAMDDDGLELLLLSLPKGSGTAALVGERPPPGSRLGPCREGAAPPQRDAASALGGIPRRPARRLRLHLGSTTFEAWKGRMRPSMRQRHVGGEKVFVDFAGDRIDIFDPVTGEVQAMKLFVAAMGASNYTYAVACPSESLCDWIGVPKSQKGGSASSPFSAAHRSSSSATT